MSYTVVKEEQKISGVRYFTYFIRETNAGASDSWAINCPGLGTVTFFKSELLSGTGATIQPILGFSASAVSGSNDYICGQASAAAQHSDQTKVRYIDEGALDGYGDLIMQGTIYGQSKVNAGSDNYIETIVVIAEGHMV